MINFTIDMSVDVWDLIQFVIYLGITLTLILVFRVNPKDSKMDFLIYVFTFIQTVTIIYCVTELN